MYGLRGISRRRWPMSGIAGVGMTILDKTYCASPNCKNECGRQMGQLEYEILKKLAFDGLKPTKYIKQAYFCGEPEEGKKSGS